MAGMFTVHARSGGFDSHRRNDFSDPVDQDICTQYALSWKKVVSEWRLVITVTLNVSGGARLIKPTKLYMLSGEPTLHFEGGLLKRDNDSFLTHTSFS